MQQVEELALGVTLTPDGLADLFQVDGGAAEDGEPHEADCRRHQHHADEEFTDGAAAGNAGQEHADEGAPGDPPRPVEDGPAAEP